MGERAKVGEWKTVSEAGLGGGRGLSWLEVGLEVGEIRKRKIGKAEKRKADRGKGIDNLSELLSLAVAQLQLLLMGGYRGWLRGWAP